MTLSRFLRDYIYIPLGGNKISTTRTYVNLLATFVIGGLWHGAGWTFIFWGFLHGMALIIHRVWLNFGLKMWTWLAWFITFNFVNIAWIFFRAKEWDEAIKVLKGMVGLSINNMSFSIGFLDKISMWLNIPFHNYLPYSVTKANIDEISLLFCLFFIPIVLIFKNINGYILNKNLTLKMILIAMLAFSYSIINSFFTSTEVFLYFNF